MLASNNQKIITIAIPFYNAEKYLALAIQSVIWQTYQDWELLLIDDGSSDNSLAIAKEYEKKDNRIRVYSDGENKNLGFRLNQIPELVETVYLARMDADDIMHPKKIEKQLNILLSDSSIDVLGTNAYTIDEDSYVIGLRKKYVQGKELFKVNSFIHPTIVAKTEWFKKNQYDIKAIRIEDSELWYRTKSSNKFMMLAEPLFFYREFGTEYYKKYFKANESKKYILNKYQNNRFWKKFFRDNLFKGIIYFTANLFGKENLLIAKRNQLIMQKKRYDEYIYSKDC